MDLKQLYKNIIERIYIKFIILCLIGLVFSITVNAKVNFQDSLYQVANNPKKSLKERYATFDRLIFLARTNDEYIYTNKICHQYIHLAKENKNYTELTKAYAHLTILCYNQDLYKEMQSMLDTSITYYKIANAPVALAYLNYAKFVQQKTFEQDGEAVKIAIQTIPIAKQNKLYFLLTRFYY